ncbi:MAG: hypothetical protein GQ531_05280, partial [Sulfurovum sp.]|nr:hypothetical protein [Sulfurovum sp.]
MTIKNLLLSVLFAFAFFTNTASASANANAHAEATAMTQEERIALEKSTYKPQSVTELIGSFFGTTGLNA